ncbi:MAG: helix-turn-helix transcriptional regulator [Gordonibacter pamelaeae]
MAIPAVLLLVFAAYVTIGLKRFTFAGVIDGIDQCWWGRRRPPRTGPMRKEQEPAPTERGRPRCPRPAPPKRPSPPAARPSRASSPSTPREAEVFAMLARGRDRAYIEEALVVSRNTVKAHVKHVYAKLGIHSHQELLDLVEG